MFCFPVSSFHFFQSVSSTSLIVLSPKIISVRMYVFQASTKLANYCSFRSCHCVIVEFLSDKVAAPHNCKNLTIFKLFLTQSRPVAMLFKYKYKYINKTNSCCCDPNIQTGSNTQKHLRRPPRLYSNTLSHYRLLGNSRLLPSNNISSQQVGCVQKSHCSKTKCVCVRECVCRCTCVHLHVCVYVCVCACLGSYKAATCKAIPFKKCGGI